MSLAVNCAYQTECSMKSIRNGYGLLCFLFIIRSPSLNWYHFEHRTFIYQRTSGISYHINDIEVGRLACLQLVGHYVACYAWLCGLGPSAQTRYQVNRSSFIAKSCPLDVFLVRSTIVVYFQVAFLGLKRRSVLLRSSLYNIRSSNIL